MACSVALSQQLLSLFANLHILLHISLSLFGAVVLTATLAVLSFSENSVEHADGGC